MALFLAADGGQTTTKIVVADERGQIRGVATGGPSNHTEEPGGPERLQQVVRSTVDDALKLAGAGSIAEEEFEAACLGMTGETVIKQRVLTAMIRTPRLAVVHDSVNALMGATAGGPGIVVIAGTGSVARGMDGHGREIRAGGWGHLFGDEGSAYGIAREAIRAVAAEVDGFGPPTQLTPTFLKRLGVSSAYELMEKYYSAEWSRDHMAGLALWVNESALAGDSVARAVLKRAGEDLAGSATALLRLLFKDELTGARHSFPILAGCLRTASYSLRSKKRYTSRVPVRESNRRCCLPCWDLSSLLIEVRVWSVPKWRAARGPRCCFRLTIS